MYTLKFKFRRLAFVLPDSNFHFFNSYPPVPSVLTALPPIRTDIFYDSTYDSRIKTGAFPIWTLFSILLLL